MLAERPHFDEREIWIDPAERLAKRRQERRRRLPDPDEEDAPGGAVLEVGDVEVADRRAGERVKPHVADDAHHLGLLVLGHVVNAVEPMAQRRLVRPECCRRQRLAHHGDSRSARSIGRREIPAGEERDAERPKKPGPTIGFRRSGRERRNRSPVERAENRIPAAAERHAAPQGRRRDARELRDLLLQPLMEERRRDLVVGSRRIDPQQEHRAGVEARIDLQQAPEAAQQEARRGQQGDRGGRLCDHEDAPADLAAVALGAGEAGAAFPEDGGGIAPRRLEGRYQTGEKRRRQGDRQGEEHDRRVDSGLGEVPGVDAGEAPRRQVGEPADDERSEEREGEGETGRPAETREDATFSEYLGDDPPAGGAQRAADGELPSPHRRPRELQPGHVGARDEENRAGGGKEEEEEAAQIGIAARFGEGLGVGASHGSVLCREALAGAGDVAGISTGETPGRARATTRSCWKSRLVRASGESQSAGRAESGTQLSVSPSSISPMKLAGRTPTTVKAWRRIKIRRPTIAGSAPKRRRQRWSERRREWASSAAPPWAATKSRPSLRPGAEHGEIAGGRPASPSPRALGPARPRPGEPIAGIRREGAEDPLGALEAVEIGIAEGARSAAACPGPGTSR